MRRIGADMFGKIAVLKFFKKRVKIFRTSVLQNIGQQMFLVKVSKAARGSCSVITHSSISCELEALKLSLLLKFMCSTFYQNRDIQLF